MGATRTASHEFPSTLARTLSAYKRAHAAELEDDPAFAAWLEDEYVPLVGGWHY
jgi:hypothetical protein